MVCNTKNKVKIGFPEGYDMLPAKFQIPVRDAIMNECGWHLVTFHNKRKGINKISGLEIKVVEKHFKKHNIDPWTGRYLTPIQ